MLSKAIYNDIQMSRRRHPESTWDADLPSERGAFFGAIDGESAARAVSPFPPPSASEGQAWRRAPENLRQGVSHGGDVEGV